MVSVSLLWFSIPFSLSLTALGYNYGFWTTRGFLSPPPDWAHKSLVNLFVFTQRLDVRNELQKGTSAFGSKTLSQVFCFPAVCELFTAVRAAVIWETHLQRKMLHWLLPACSLPLFPLQFPFSPPIFPLFPFPSTLHTLHYSFPLPFFCLLGILRMMSESPSLLKIHCQINIKACGKIQLALCDLLWCVTQDPGSMAHLLTSQRYEGLGDPQLLETP